jgi:hypothetical protein
VNIELEQAVHAGLTLSTGAAAYAVMHAMHGLGDHWVQTHKCSQDKALPGWEGRIACAIHVASYTATMTLALIAAALGTALTIGLGWAGTWTLLAPWHLTGAMALTAITHYAIDRRKLLEKAAIVTGHGPFLAVGGPLGGRYLLDQTAHIGLLLVAAAIIAAGAPAPA